MTELEKEEFNKLKESCKKSIESIQEHLNSEELTLEELKLRKPLKRGFS